MKFRNKNGFTLIELLVVVALIGVLSAILLPSLNQARTKARDSKRVAEFRQINYALALYYAIHDQYPSLLNVPVWTGVLCYNDPTCMSQSDASWNDMITRLETEKFLAIKQEPKTWVDKLDDVFFSKVFATLVQDPQYPAKHYAYMTMPGNQNYRLRAEFENNNNPLLLGALPGKFYWSDKSTGVDACDSSLKFYCSGPADDFSSFDPGKPVIYLYPTHTEQISVKIEASSIDVSVPKYDDGWNVVAHPDGRLDNILDGKSYPYLYWEGHSGKPIINKQTGNVVAQKDIESFLMSVLKKQGLTISEAKEFVEYWAPQMKGKPYVYVYFMPQSDYDKLIPLHVSPKPDTIIRTYMLWKGIDMPIVVTPQIFKTPTRKGFTVVEWGGDRQQIR